MESEQELFTYVNKVYAKHHTNLQKTLDEDSATSFTALTQTYFTFKYSPQTLNLSIPTDLWKRFDDTMRKRINQLCQEIRAEKKKPPTPSSAQPAPIGNQYPIMNGDAPKDADIEAAINAIYNFAASKLDDDDSTGTIDDNMELFTLNMVYVDHGDIPVWVITNESTLTIP